MPSIPFNRPSMVGKELEYIARAVEGGHLSGNGPFTKRCHAWLEEYTGAPKVLLTHSCTAALEMAALLCDIGPDDEVLLPSYTFVSTANAFLLRGARPIFIDIDPITLNMDVDKLESALTNKTKAIVPVHYAGRACAMERIKSIATHHGLRVIEDAAQAVGSRLEGKALGSLGDLGCFSFHETKNFISGEGGALIINDASLAERAEHLWEKGTNRTDFFRGNINKYTWVDVGSSFLPSELIAAFLCAQLECAETIQQQRLAIVRRYQNAFTPLRSSAHVQFPDMPKAPSRNSLSRELTNCSDRTRGTDARELGPSTQDAAGQTFPCDGRKTDQFSSAAPWNGHMFYLLLPNARGRESLLNHLRQNDIHAVFHYVPLHLSPMGEKLGYLAGDFPVSEDIAARILRLPVFFGLKEAEQNHIITVILDYFSRD